MILIGNSYVGHSQATDTICFDTPVARKVLAAAMQKKVADSLLSIAEKQLLQCQNSIKLLGEKEVELKSNYEVQITNLNSQIALYKDQINGYERLLRKEKRKRVLTTIAGTLTTAAGVFLFITK